MKEFYIVRNTDLDNTYQKDVICLDITLAKKKIREIIENDTPVENIQLFRATQLTFSVKIDINEGWMKK